MVMLPMFSAAQLALAQEIQQKQLNIVCILTDDHAFQAISAYGHPISKLAPTPNIDRLAENGMLFTRSFVENSISAPSRATFLTGLYSHQHGQTRLGCCLNPQKQWFTELLQEKGYITSVFGKWHLNVEPKGFDFYDILFDQGEYYNPRFRRPDTNGEYIKEKGYVTTLITDHVIKWLEQNISGGQPFCILVNHKAPHRNWMPDFPNMHLFEDADFPEPKTLFDDYATRGPQMESQELTIDRHMGYAFDFKVRELEDEPTLQYIRDSWPLAMGEMDDEQRAAWVAIYERKNKAFLEKHLTGKELLRWKYQRYITEYCRTIRSVDEQVGRLLDYLDEKGLMDNTVIVYTSDQGFLLGEHGLYDKRFMYEESFRTPLIISCPFLIKKQLVCKELVQNIDLAPTFLNIAGAKVPEEMPGLSLLPLFKKGKTKNWRDALYYHFYDYPAVGNVRKHYGIRTRRYKLIHWYGEGSGNDSAIDSWEMYDLKKDRVEINNVYDNPKYAKIRESLKVELGLLCKDAGVTE